MKKANIILIIVISVILFATSCGTFSSKISDKERDVNSSIDYIFGIIDIKIPKDSIIEDADTFAGFPADGTYFAKVTFPDEYAKSYANAFLELVKAKNWQQLPLTEEIDIIMYGGTVDGTKISYLYAEEVGLPKVENGYWYFNDRSREKDKDFYKRYSYKFDLSIFDTDNNILYVYRLIM